MGLFVLAIIAALAFIDDPGPAELVGLLGSADRIEREEAARTLEELGAEALSALHDAERAAPAEARSRATFIARLIEGKLLVRPTLVDLNFDDRPLEEAIRTLAARSGHAITIDAGNDVALPRRPIRAKATAPIPFWEALDTIGRAGHVRHDPGAKPWDSSLATVLHIADGDPPSKTLYRGPFRVHLPGLHRRKDLNLRGGAGRGPSSTNVLYIDLQAFAEPGRFLDFDGMPRLEATDDRGGPLPPPPANADRPGPYTSSWNVPGAIGVMQWRLPLGLPDPKAVNLRRLRGTLPAIVSATRPGPLVISLDDAPGKTYRHEDTTIRFRILYDSEKQTQIEATLTRDPGPDATRDDRAHAAFRHRFAFEDRDGQPLSWLPQFENAGPGNEVRIQLMISEGKRPIRLRLHGLVWTATEIPFEFADVPLP